MSCAHGRDNVTTVKMAMDENGKFLAFDCDLVAAMGAYDHSYGAFIPQLGMTIATGCYDIPAARFRITGVYTNTVPTDAYRGAGRPEAIYALERLVDVCAAEMGLAPEEIRRRNFIAPDEPSPTPRPSTAPTTWASSRRTWTRRCARPTGRASSSVALPPPNRAAFVVSACPPSSKPAPSPARNPRT